MRPGEFNTAMVHLYRGEITRSNVWRTRLDSTTNWAVVTTAGVLTFAFSSVTNSHAVILISFMLVWLFLFIETRRYRYYELWALRVRLMETDFFAAMLNPPYAPHEEWAKSLATTLLNPEFPISYLEALGRRLRRNYMWLFLILGVAWFTKLLLHPIPAHSIDAFIRHAGIGFISGYVVFSIVTLFFGQLLLIAVLTTGLQQSAGEVLSKSNLLTKLTGAAGQVLSTELPFQQRRELLTLIITDKAELVSEQLLAFLKRGVTSLQGTGMYSKTPRSVLLCVVSPSEVAELKALVYAVDEHAFVVVNRTDEALGGGFGDLRPDWRGGSSQFGENS